MNDPVIILPCRTCNADRETYPDICDGTRERRCVVCGHVVWRGKTDKAMSGDGLRGIWSPAGRGAVER